VSFYNKLSNPVWKSFTTMHYNLRTAQSQSATLSLLSLLITTTLAALNYIHHLYY